MTTTGRNRRSPAALRRAAVLATLAAASLARPDAADGPDVVWMWSGALTPTSAVIKAKVQRAGADLHLRYDLDRRLAGPRRAPLDTAARPDEDGVVAFALSGLIPNTQYFYAVADNDGSTRPGEFRTPAEDRMSFAFAAASCAGGNIFSTVSNSEVFTSLEDRRPLFFVHMGDFHYKNISRNEVGLFRRAYDQVLTQPRQASLYRRVPIVYMWDDHDYGPNDSDGTSPSRDASRTAYDEIVPHYPLALEDGAVTTVQQAFTIGRVRFIVTDLRSARDPLSAPDGPEKSMLGLRQRAWLDAELTRAAGDASLVVWVSTVPWITRIGNKEDGWEPYSWERRWIADRIAALGLTARMVMVAGDAHMVAIDDGTNSNYATTAAPGARGFPVLQAAPLDRANTVKGGPYSKGISTRNNQFGWVDVRDDGAALQVTLSGHDRSGGEISGMRLPLVCRDGSCQVVP